MNHRAKAGFRDPLLQNRKMAELSRLQTFSEEIRPVGGLSRAFWKRKVASTHALRRAGHVLRLNRNDLPRLFALEHGFEEFVNVFVHSDLSPSFASNSRQTSSRSIGPCPI